MDKVVEKLAATAEALGPIQLVAADASETGDREFEVRELLAVADRVRAKLGDSGAVVLASPADGKAGLVAAVGPAAIEKGLSAADIVREAAEVVGGGGGGRENVAQAGGRDPEKLGEALALARKAIESKL